MTWDPAQYLTFGGHRIRPALDLLSAVPMEAPARILDLGCGPGNVTQFLQGRWPDAKIVGLDSSAEMLEKARAAHPNMEWIEADLSEWVPEEPFDLLYSNAVLQWVKGHTNVFPDLLKWVKPGGYIAIQMPRNFNAPSHVLARETAAGPRWKDRIGGALLRDPVADPDVYYRLLGDLGFSHIDIWETEYLHVLEGDDPVLEWVKGTALTPVFALIDGQERADFVAEYGAALRIAYPKQPDGRTLFPFRRIFLTARR